MTSCSGDLRVNIPAGGSIRYWRISDTVERRYDVEDRPMQGRMDAQFFLASHKNFIPHEYPCRTEFARQHRGRRPRPVAEFSTSRWWLPFGSDRVDLSGFWFRATHLAAWAETVIEAEAAGPARLSLATCGGAILFVNDAEAGFLAAYKRNLETREEFQIELCEGANRIRVYFDDLAERDARFYFQLDYISGPAAEIALPVPIRSEIAQALERIAEGMHFERPSYFSEEVALALPQPAPEDLRVELEINDDFLSPEPLRLVLTLPRGADRLVLGRVEELPSDFRHYRFTLRCGDFAVSRTLAVEICDADRQGAPPPSLAERIEEAIRHVAEQSESDTVRAFARLAAGQGGDETDRMIAAALPSIEDCHDCSDFMLVPLLWARIAWGGAIGASLRDRIDRAILGYRYWLDEPGNDVQWYFSENHALLFHTAGYLAGHLFPDAVFRRSGRSGREQAEINLARVRAWLDHFERWSMAEWNSAPYFPIDFKGLAALHALAPDADVRRRAGAAMLALLRIVARSCHHGLVTASQGRSYEHSLIPSRSLELSGIARLLWSHGWFGRRFHALPLIAVCIRDHGLAVPEDLAAVAAFDGPEAQEWCFAQGENHMAKLYHYKTRHYAIGSVAAYRPGAWGYQETVLHLRLGQVPEAQVWINHPGEVIQFGYGRPSYWGGCGALPRVHQYRALALLDFDIHEGQPDFTHAWLPQQAFDAIEVNGRVIAAQSGEALLLMVGNADFEQVMAGPTAGIEVRLPGRKGCWLVRLSDVGTEGSLAAFLARFSAMKAETGGDMIVINDPDYGPVTCEASGLIRAEGRILDPRLWSIEGEARLLKAGGLGYADGSRMGV
ncbi:hypothetical protein [Chelativorans sp.]|uniref:hypothetical protein n=1 Tax=Chelativorans sp. TaxID=2203393 RepID=UPI0028116837|nr:hypothetical protein [Chelativorans sp.]